MFCAKESVAGTDCDRTVVRYVCPRRLAVFLVLERTVKHDVKRRQVIDADCRPVNARPVLFAKKTLNIYHNYNHSFNVSAVFSAT